MAIFVDVSYQSDLLGLSAGKVEIPKLTITPVLCALEYTMELSHSVSGNVTTLYLSCMLDGCISHASCCVGLTPLLSTLA